MAVSQKQSTNLVFCQIRKTLFVDDIPVTPNIFITKDEDDTVNAVISLPVCQVETSTLSTNGNLWKLKGYASCFHAFLLS